MTNKMVGQLHLLSTTVYLIFSNDVHVHTQRDAQHNSNAYSPIYCMDAGIKSICKIIC